MLEQNQEVQKPAEFMLQRVEKESWQQDESGGKIGGEIKQKSQESTAEEEKGEFWCCWKKKTEKGKEGIEMESLKNFKKELTLQ